MANTPRKRHWRKWMKRRTPPGASPGTLSIDPASPRPIITVIAYGSDKMVEQVLDSAQDIKKFLGKYPVTWINVDGLGDAKTIQQIGAVFSLHRLALEDVVNVHQRAKVEDYDDYLFIVVRMVELASQLETEQVSIFLGSNFVLTFQERPGKDSIEPLRDRIRGSRGRVRSAGADYLAYGLIDAVLDGYFPVLEKYGEMLEDLEDEVTQTVNQATTARIHNVKSDLLLIRRSIWPHREAINVLVRDGSNLIQPETRLYLRDCYDHAVQLIDMVETYRELGADLRDLYLSSISNRMNEIMKVLTIISTIFIPLTFIAGIYGMNFQTDKSPWNMPELEWYYGYPFSLAMMAAVTAGMIVFFRRKGWLGGSRSKNANRGNLVSQTAANLKDPPQANNTPARRR